MQASSSYYLEFSHNLVKLRKQNNPAKVRPGDSSPRGRISSFSSRSRQRLLERLLSLSVPPTCMITLTYPRFYPADAKVWKKHLDNFAKALLYQFPQAWFFWKLEPQKRGAPHFHLVGYLGENLNPTFVRKWVSYTWYRIVRSGYHEHLLAGTRVDFIVTPEQVSAYVCKYVAKASTVSYPEWAHPGRFWGIIGRKNLPPRLINHVRLTRKQFMFFRRTLRKWARKISPALHKALLKRLSLNIVMPSSIVEELIKHLQLEVESWFDGECQKYNLGGI